MANLTYQYYENNQLIQRIYRENTSLSMRQQINHPNIIGPFDIGWGYTDFGGAGMSGRIGVPTLPGQLTSIGKGK